MTKDEYLRIKKERLKSPRQSRPTCVECLRPSKACFCPIITPFETNVHFRILMHPMEARRAQVGTGRMANKALSNCKIIVGEGFFDNSEVNNLLQDNETECFLLYPGADSLNLTNSPLEVQTNKKIIIFILDSTWACSKKMLRLSPNLKSLPKISFEANYLSRFEIKKQPRKYCLSTIESIYRLIEELEGHKIEQVGEKKEILRHALKTMVEFHQECTADPHNKHYRE